jgi:AraC-like DNA-binding protein
LGASPRFQAMLGSNGDMGPCLSLHGEAGGVVAVLFDKILGEYRARELGWREMARAYCTELLVAIFRQREKADRPQATASEKAIAEIALDYMRAHYGEDISSDTLAKQVFLSAGYFRHLFRKATGRRVSEALSGIRAEKACQMLMCGAEVSTADILAECGFPDAKAFYKAFREIVGMSPGEWRQRGGGAAGARDGAEVPVWPEDWPAPKEAAAELAVAEPATEEPTAEESAVAEPAAAALVAAEPAVAEL